MGGWVKRVPPLTLLAVDEVVALIGPSVQRYLTADAAELGFDSLSLQGVDSCVDPSVDSLVEHE